MESLIIFLITVAITATVHELGHFMAARMFGIKVRSFAIGFGQRLFFWRDKYGTEFRFGWIPLGGYVNMDPQNFNSRSLLIRFLVIIAGPAMNFLLAWGLLALFFLSVQTAGIKTLDYTWLTFKAIANMVTGNNSIKELIGPIGIAQYARHSTQLGAVFYLHFLALINISIGVFNLLPIPILDGGYFWVFLYELIFRRPMPVHYSSLLDKLGALLLISLIIFVILNDLRYI